MAAKKEPKKGADREQAILFEMQNNPSITQVALMQEFDLTRKQVQKTIKDFRNDGKLDREGSNRNGKWIVKK